MLLLTTVCFYLTPVSHMLARINPKLACPSLASKFFKLAQLFLVSWPPVSWPKSTKQITSLGIVGSRRVLGATWAQLWHHFGTTRARLFACHALGTIWARKSWTPDCLLGPHWTVVKVKLQSLNTSHIPEARAPATSWSTNYKQGCGWCCGFQDVAGDLAYGKTVWAILEDFNYFKKF